MVHKKLIMNEDELERWFINKVNSCYPVVCNDMNNRIFWFYDESHIRNQKLCKINNKKIPSNHKINGTFMFEQNNNYGLIYCNYETIWKELQRNYDNDYDIRTFINNIIKKTSNLNFSNVYCEYSQTDFIGERKELIVSQTYSSFSKTSFRYDIIKSYRSSLYLL